MRYLILTAIVLLSMGGCGSLGLVVEEDSVIPTHSMEDAYLYAEQCIDATQQSIVQAGEYKGAIPSEMMAAVARSCGDNMFILFASTTYTVMENGRYGKPSVVCSEATVEGVNRCMGN